MCTLSFSFIPLKLNLEHTTLALYLIILKLNYTIPKLNFVLPKFKFIIPKLNFIAVKLNFTLFNKKTPRIPSNIRNTGRILFRLYLNALWRVNYFTAILTLWLVLAPQSSTAYMPLGIPDVEKRAVLPAVRLL